MSAQCEVTAKAAAGSDEKKRHAFVDAMNQLQRRICMFVSLPFRTLDGIKLQTAVRDIGKTA